MRIQELEMTPDGMFRAQVSRATVFVHLAMNPTKFIFNGPSVTRLAGAVAPPTATAHLRSLYLPSTAVLRLATSRRPIATAMPSSLSKNTTNTQVCFDMRQLHSWFAS